ncbi:MAG TPA: methyl-accepting chemotaxis protein [Planctomycetota bacterium]|nr:methyl-accepting chemotaxis protein [Planctomycetota bacterium]
MRISARIWSGVSIMLVGYVLTVLVEAWLGHQSSLQLDQARAVAMPATLRMYEVRAGYMRALNAYQAAVLEGEPSNLETADKEITQVQAGLDEISAQSWLPSSRRSELKTKSTTVADTHKAAMALYKRMAGGEKSDELQAQGGKMKASTDALAEALQAALDGVRDDLGAVLSGVSGTAKRQLWISLGAMVVVVLISFVAITLIVGRKVIQPLNGLRGHLSEIAQGNGDLTRRIPVTTDASGKTSDDEVSQLAASFNLFLDNLQALIKKVGLNTGKVTGASGQLDKLSQQVATNADVTRSNAQTARSVSQEVTSDMMMVGAAVEEMVSSIREISGSAQTAAQIASEAVTEVRGASDTIGRLSASTASIGEVLRMIEKVAAQTNLLALNATIEAARAGEAGRGFAVVANEVKELAKQTAGATADIQSRIGAIQSDSTSVQEAIGRINKVIDQINQASVSIAGAVEEQTATTQQMSQLINGAVSKTNQINQTVEAMTGAVDSTATCAKQTEDAAGDLATSASELTSVVGSFKY